MLSILLSWTASQYGGVTPPYHYQIFLQPSSSTVGARLGIVVSQTTSVINTLQTSCSLLPVSHGSITV